MKRILEICCGDIESVAAAAEAGAHRIELCCALGEGGLTPSPGLLKLALEFGLPVNVLIRPRKGDFLYSERELEVMLADIEWAVDAGASGVVIGALTPEGDIDAGKVERMVKAAKGRHVTFHRAFDVCRDPDGALRRIIAAGCDTLLTSGQAPDALAGAPLIRRLREMARGEIAIMAGCGVNPANAAEILALSGADAIHSTASKSFASGMKFRKGEVSMGAQDDGLSFRRTDPAIAKRLREIIDSYGK